MTKKNFKNDVTNINRADIAWAIDLAVETGKVLAKKQAKLTSLKVHHKEAQGVASTADLLAEEKIIKSIKKRFPTHEILAEESAYKIFKGEKEKYEFLSDKEWVWVIDPLDGTNNFLNGLDYFAICISLVNKGIPIFGIVYRPIQGDLFYAQKNQGSFYQNILRKIKPKKIKKTGNKKNLKECLLVTGFTTEKGELFDREFDLFKNMMGKSRGIRRMGSAALDLCYVATGLFDAFWERGLAPWDVAAAGLICAEAGVQISNYEGEAFHPFQSTIVAAKNPLKNALDVIIRAKTKA